MKISKEVRISNLSGDKGFFQSVFPRLVSISEKSYDVQLNVDNYIMVEVWQRVEKTLSLYNMDDPNEAKKASAVAFWIRKLKPVSYRVEVAIDKYNPYINEILGLIFSIIIYYTPKKGRLNNMSSLLKALQQDRVFKDLIKSYRYHSHSPHSSVFLFELMLGNTVLQLK